MSNKKKLRPEWWYWCQLKGDTVWQMYRYEHKPRGESSPKFCLGISYVYDENEFGRIIKVRPPYEGYEFNYVD